MSREGATWIIGSAAAVGAMACIVLLSTAVIAGPLRYEALPGQVDRLPPPVTNDSTVDDEKNASLAIPEHLRRRIVNYPSMHAPGTIVQWDKWRCSTISWIALLASLIALPTSDGRLVSMPSSQSLLTAYLIIGKEIREKPAIPAMTDTETMAAAAFAIETPITRPVFIIASIAADRPIA